MIRWTGEILSGGSHGKEVDEHQQRREPDHFARGSGSGVLRSWGAKDAGLVWRRWFPGLHGRLCAHGNTCSGWVADHLRAIVWRTRTRGWIAYSHCLAWSYRPDDRSDLHGASEERVLHELDGGPEG